MCSSSTWPLYIYTSICCGISKHWWKWSLECWGIVYLAVWIINFEFCYIWVIVEFVIINFKFYLNKNDCTECYSNFDSIWKGVILYVQKYVENIEYNFLLKISFEKKFILEIYVHVNLAKFKLIIDRKLF